MINSTFFKIVLVTIIIRINTSKCDHDKVCYHKCLAESALRNPHSNIDIYLEYKKAVIKVPDPPKIETNRFITLPSGEIIPGMLRYDPQRPKFIWKRQLRAIITKTDEATLREFQVDPLEESCSSNNLMKTRQKVNCKPRPSVLEVVSTKGKVYPNKVLTKQCAGYCSGNTICSAIKSKNISSSVQVVLDNGAVQCSTILVPQDTKCKCMCATSEKDCNSNQKFNKKLCACECNNNKEKDHCERKMRLFPNQHFWNSKTCSCACLRKSPCTTGTFWDRTRCGCSKKTDNG